MSAVAAHTRLRKGVMVCLSSDPRGSETILRKASRIANQDDAELYVVHVQTPAETARIAGGEERYRELLDRVLLAADLGAEVVWLKAHDVADAILDFARDARISRIIIRRSKPGMRSRLVHRSVTRRLVDRARNVEIEILNVAGGESIGARSEP